MQVILNIEINDHPALALCEYHRAEPENNAEESLEVECVSTDSFEIEREDLLELYPYTVKDVIPRVFANFLEYEFIANCEHDSSPNPFGEWIK